MDFRPTAEQSGFAQSLRELMQRADAIAAARAWAAGDTAPGLALWRRLADQGVAALIVPESDGGLGGSPVDLVMAFEALGHELAVGPWIETAAFLGRALPGADAGSLDAVLEGILSGEVATVAVSGLAPLALDAHAAAHVVVAGGSGLRVAGESFAVADAHRSVDTTRLLFPLGLSGPESLDPALAGAADLAVLACAAELLGAGERLLADSVAYVGARKQYGRTIGSYQAIKHQLADVRIALDFARPLVHGAALTLDGPAGARDVSAAKIAAGEAAYLASRVGLQLHGAIGYTAEFDLGLWITRVRALVGAWGGPSWHRARVADALLSDLPAAVAR